VRKAGGPVETAFHNTGLYNLDGRGAYPASDTGLLEVTGQPGDMGRFRAPSLHNLTLTAPYMHDGSLATLDAVIDHYAAGGRTIAAGRDAGDGSASPLKDGLVLGFSLGDDERSDLAAFFASLTDERFVRDPAFGQPFVDCPYALPAGCDGAPPSFAATIAPLVAARCVPCHGDGGPAANMPLGTQPQLAAQAASALTQVHGCTMPPAPTATPLTAAERALFLAWLACGAPAN
jgi:hypothetical protein